MLRSRRRAEQLIDSLKGEIAELRDENARLRSDEQRALDPHAVAAELHDLALAATLREGAAGDGPMTDDRCRELLDLQVVRQGLIEVCTRLQVLAGQLHRQLSEGAPAPEIDRRVADLDDGHARRRDDRRNNGSPNANGNGNGNGNGGTSRNGSPNGNGRSRNGGSTGGSGKGRSRNGKARNKARRNGTTSQAQRNEELAESGRSGDGTREVRRSQNGKPRSNAARDRTTANRLNWGSTGPSSAASIRKANRNRRGHP